LNRKKKKEKGRKKKKNGKKPGSTCQKVFFAQTFFKVFFQFSLSRATQNISHENVFLFLTTSGEN
jgi:hypothetical protein